MPKLYNADHQTQIIHGVELGVAPGEPHNFTDEEIAAGIAGQWSTKNPRQGLPQERAFKRRRDAPVAEKAAAPDDSSVPASGDEEV